MPPISHLKCSLVIVGHLTQWVKAIPFPNTTANNVVKTSIKNIKAGRGGSRLAYNPSTLGGRGGWIMRSRDRDHPGQHGETPSLLKTQKLAGHGGVCL